MTTIAVAGKTDGVRLSLQRALLAGLLVTALGGAFTIAGVHDHGWDESQRTEICPVCALTLVDSTIAEDAAVVVQAPVRSVAITELAVTVATAVPLGRAPSRAPPVSS